MPKIIPLLNFPPKFFAATIHEFAAESLIYHEGIEEIEVFAPSSSIPSCTSWLIFSFCRRLIHGLRKLNQQLQESVITGHHITILPHRNDGLFNRIDATHFAMKVRRIYSNIKQEFFCFVKIVESIRITKLIGSTGSHAVDNVKRIWRPQNSTGLSRFPVAATDFNR